MLLDLPRDLSPAVRAPACERKIGAPLVFGVVPAIAIRAVRPDDAELLRAFFRALSPNSRTRRFHGGMGDVPADLLAQFTRNDDHGSALVAVAEGAGRDEIVGEARYVIERPREAEFAIVVTDRVQGCGLGKRMLQSIVRLAASAGVRRLYGDVQYDNKAMLALAATLGFLPRRAQSDPRLQTVERIL